MLPLAHRLKKDKDFKKIYRKGERIRGFYFDLYWLGNNLGKARVGIVINSKIATKATQRNKQKRFVRTEIKKLLAILKRGFDVIIKIKKKIETPQKNQARNELEKKLKKIFNVK